MRYLLVFVLMIGIGLLGGLGCGGTPTKQAYTAPPAGGPKKDDVPKPPEIPQPPKGP